MGNGETGEGARKEHGGGDGEEGGTRAGVGLRAGEGQGSAQREGPTHSPGVSV